MAKEKRLHAEERQPLPPLWTKYQVRFDFLTKLCGSVPADPELIKAWVEASKPSVRPPGGKTIEEIQEEVLASLATPPVEQELSMLVFQRHNEQCVVRAATVRAHIKDCARVLSAQYIGRIEGERAFSTRVINGVYPDPSLYWVPVMRPEGTPVTTHDGERDKPIHVRTIRGEPMNALKRYQWIEPARIDITLMVLGNSIKQSDLEHVLRYGGVHGYGGERGDGEGKYMATITKLEENGN